FFFFSSRRRHTRFSRDWSSDVCSSDLFQRINHPLILFYLIFTRTDIVSCTLQGITFILHQVENDFEIGNILWREKAIPLFVLFGLYNIKLPLIKAYL